MGLFGYIYRLRRHLRYSKQEILSIILASILFGIILGFDEWGYGNIVDINLGIYNTISYIFYSFIALILIRTSQKMMAIAYGYEGMVEIDPRALIASILIGIVSLGKLPLMLSGRIFFKSHKTLRVGRFRQLYMHHELGLSIIAGIIPFLILAIFKDIPFLYKLSWITGLILLFTWLPIPSQDGIMLFFYMRPALYIIFMIGFGVLLLTYHYSFLIGLILALIAVILATIIIEKNKVV
ncbi:hypothetical protein J7K74_02430 [Candidatus Woesearchaeota archaeon]|nr:hypothetical protein [Candidatus Woesearchaeota archaeon]